MVAVSGQLEFRFQNNAAKLKSFPPSSQQHCVELGSEVREKEPMHLFQCSNLSHLEFMETQQQLGLKI